jgi:hypothetical protein
MELATHRFTPLGTAVTPRASPLGAKWLHHTGGGARDLSEDLCAMMSLLRMCSKIIELAAASLFDAGG